LLNFPSWLFYVEDSDMYLVSYSPSIAHSNALNMGLDALSSYPLLIEIRHFFFSLFFLAPLWLMYIS
jgi:hypothetical protein